MASKGPPTPEGVFTLLDTDLYKLTMQCAVLKYFPDTGNSTCASEGLMSDSGDCRGFLCIHKSNTSNAP